MIDKQRYFDGKNVNRVAIAMDIKYRRISHDQVMEIVNDPDISSTFFEDSYKDKVPKNQWNEKYLDELSYAVVAESFNKDYLLYLEKVANSVSSKKNNYKIVIGGIVLTVAVVALVVVIGNLI